MGDLVGEDEIHRSLEQLSKSSESATHLVNQLLTLARAENQTPASKPFKLLELSELARDIVHDWVQISFTRRIDLEWDEAEQARIGRLLLATIRLWRKRTN